MPKQRYITAPKILPALLSFWLSVCAYSETIWHCSRSHDAPVQTAKDNYLNRLDGQSHEVIRLTIRDLYDAYQGVPVYLGKTVLSACFMATNDEESKSALEGIGTDQAEIRAIAQQTHSKFLIMVHDESEMLSCIAKNHPSIGYVSGAVNTSAIGPCF